MNWEEEWKKIREEKGHSSAVEFWDDFAPRFRKKPKKGEKDPYVENFYSLSRIEKGDTIFDMGCASGTLAVPFAEKGHDIVACDFSPGMLEVLKEEAKEAKVIEKVTPIQLDWNEDWNKRNLPVCDVAISSRSLISNNLKECILKLESVATKRVCLALWTTGRHSYDRTIAKAIGYNKPYLGSFTYALNLLLEMNRLPELSYIKAPFRPRKFTSLEDCIEQTEGEFPEKLSEEQHKKLIEYVKEHLIEKEEKEEKFFVYDHDGTAIWAFVAWNIER